jgi:BirA family biotin operon repressor/biotin-[acetyl-CoA-carboxylase] ligase
MTFALSSDRIGAFCGPAARHVDIQVVDETGSTNADLMVALGRLSAPTLLIARSQTAGRGRAGRHWHSAPGHSLTFSLAWRFGLPVHGLLGLPLAVGVALAESLAMFHVDAGLKWPNDVMLEGRKLAGILIESAAAGRTAEEGGWAVIGVGVNMMISERAAEEIGRPVAALPWLAELDQDMLVATILNGLANAMEQFDKEGLGPFLQRWNALNVYEGQPICILDNGRVIHEGIGRGVDATGRFVLDTAAGRVAVMAGDVSLRPREG